MTETSDTATPDTAATRKRSGGLSSMLLADLKSMAASMGIAGAQGLRKAQLVEAIKAAQSGGSASPRSEKAAQPAEVPAVAAPKVTRRQRGGASSDGAAREEADQAAARGATSAPASTPAAEAPQARREETRPERTRRTGAERGGAEVEGDESGEAQPHGDTRKEKPQRDSAQKDRPQKDRPQNEKPQKDNARKQDASKGQGAAKNDDAQKAASQNKQQGNNQGNQRGNQQGNQNGPKGQDNQAGQTNQSGQSNQSGQGNQPGQNSAATQVDDDGDDEGGSRSRNRRRRARERNRPGTPTGTQRNEPDTTILEDDVLVPAAGILDVLDNYAFVRTSGYLPGSDDVYLSLSLVRRFNLRTGDAVAGQVRQPREGERKEKFDPMVSIDAINGAEPDSVKQRGDFASLTAVHPEQRLRLETGADDVVGRVLDLAAPLGKGQRGLIIAPAKTGKTTLLQSVASSISTNNPECHLMVVLVDERPEEVTDFERTVKGEVISSTFDRPAADHTAVAELAIERAKRLVELGHDVVVLLDGLTRLGRAYNLAQAGSGRMLSGGVDSGALHPPKRFFGAARNIEDGGSLTILATLSVESGSRTDEMIFEELEGTANTEIRLRSELAERGLFPAVDVVASGSRREELLLGEQELDIVWSLRRTLSGLERTEAATRLLDKIGSTRTNIELLTSVRQGGL